MSKQYAKCECGCCTLLIFEDKVICPICKKEYPFNFICEGICETKANDLVILINEGY